MSNDSTLNNYGDLGQLYAEMIFLCKPLYQLPSSSSSEIQVGGGNSSQHKQEEEEFYLHPRLEDGLNQCHHHQQQQQRQQHPYINQYENPQDAATATDSVNADNNCITSSTYSSATSSRNNININYNNNHNYFSQHNHQVIR